MTLSDDEIRAFPLLFFSFAAHSFELFLFLLVVVHRTLQPAHRSFSHLDQHSNIAFTQPGCKDPNNDPHANEHPDDDNEDEFKNGLKNWCTTKKAAAIFLFWLDLGTFFLVASHRVASVASSSRWNKTDTTKALWDDLLTHFLYASSSFLDRQLGLPLRSFDAAYLWSFLFTHELQIDPRHRHRHHHHHRDNNDDPFCFFSSTRPGEPRLKL